MPNPVPRDLSAHALAAAEVIRNQNPTTSRKAGANGAAVDLRRSTAAGEESAVRRSRRAPQPSAKVLENNRQVEAVQELELDTASPSATAKRKQRDLEANDGPETSRRRVTFAPADKDDADDTSLLAADASTELSTTAVQIDHVQILKGRVGLMEDSDDDDDGDDDDDDEYLEGNNSSNMPRQKESKMRGERPRGNIKGRALVTDFTNSSSINENFPKYRDKNKYGQRNVPKSILAEYGDKVKKARCVTQWRKMTPNQQKAVCEQIAAKRKKQEAEAKELKANEKRMKQREKEAEKLRRQEATAAKKIANEENRKAKKRESEKKRRDEAKAKAAENPIVSRHLNPEAAVRSSFSQQQLNNASAKGAKRTLKDAASSAKHMNDNVARTLEDKMRKIFYETNHAITPKETNHNDWLTHTHTLITMSELPEAPLANGGPSTRNTVCDQNYDSTKPLDVTVHCASEAGFGDFLEHLQ